VPDAERTMLEAQDLLAASETATATSLVALYKALGGSWEMSGSYPCFHRDHADDRNQIRSTIPKEPELETTANGRPAKR